MDAPRIASSTRALRHVFLRDLVLSASIGIYPHEHAARQRVRINVDLGVEDDGARADVARSGWGRDELSRVVDYEEGRRYRPWHRQRRARPGWWRPWRSGSPRLVCPTRGSTSRESGWKKLDIFADAASAGVEIERRQADFRSTR